MVNVDGVVPRSLSYGVNILQFILFAQVCSHCDDFNNRNRFLTLKFLISKVVDTITTVKLFSKFYYRHSSELIVIYIYIYIYIYIVVNKFR